MTANTEQTSAAIVKNRTAGRPNQVVANGFSPGPPLPFPLSFRNAVVPPVWRQRSGFGRQVKLSLLEDLAVDIGFDIFCSLQPLSHIGWPVIATGWLRNLDVVVHSWRHLIIEL